MDKNTLINLGVDKLAAIIVKLYNDSLHTCTDSQKQERDYKMLKQNHKKFSKDWTHAKAK